jgi:hypothetical protein
MELLKKVMPALRTGLRTLMPVCRQVSRMQSDGLDQSLSPAKRIGVRLHLLICKWCRRYGEQIRFLSKAARNHPDELAAAVPQKLSDEARERIKGRLRAQGK